MSLPLTSHQVFVDYRFQTSRFVGIVLGGEVNPFQYSTPLLYNPGFRIGDAKLVLLERFTLGLDLRFYPPMNSLSQELRMIVGFASQHRALFRSLHSDFFLESFGIVRANSYGQDTRGRSFFLFERFGFNFQMNSWLGSHFSTLLQMSKDQGKGKGLQMEPPRIGPGLFFVFKDFEVNTQLNFQAQNPTLFDMSFICFLGVRLQ